MKRYDKDYDSMIESPEGKWVRFEEAKRFFKAPQNTTHNSDYAKCKEVLRLMFEAAMDADRCGELYDSFDGELLDMAKEALK